AEKKTPGLMLEYANFLVESDNPGRAAPFYDQVISLNKEALKQDSAGNTMLLNNLAWSLMQSASFSQEKVISIVKEAYALSPKNLHVLDTYAEVLNKTGNYKECIKLLDGNTAAGNEPRLLFHLGSALEKNREINKAVRYYRDVLRLMDSTRVLPFTESKENVRGRIETLTSSKS
ncbi:MAG: hypothetical protein PHC61_18505, partial [Chitinivibrionales bacterium]|nr:hypothetical protein [Chitinivibrionales bacterium]